MGTRRKSSGPRFRLGDRVRKIGCFFGGTPEVPLGTMGTVSEVATFGGRSIYPDPARLMVFVEWDNGAAIGVFRREVEKVRKGEESTKEGKPWQITRSSTA